MENSWIFLIMLLIFGCYFLYKRGKYKEEESIYKKSMKCPWDKDFCAVEGRSTRKGFVTIVCSRCPRWINK